MLLCKKLFPHDYYGKICSKSRLENLNATHTCRVALKNIARLLQGVDCVGLFKNGIFL